LIQLADAVEYLAVGADSLSWPDQDQITDDECAGVDHLLNPLLREAYCPLGCECQECVDGVLGAPGRERFERAGGSEDDDQQRSVEDLPDRRGHERGHDHE